MDLAFVVRFGVLHWERDRGRSANSEDVPSLFFGAASVPSQASEVVDIGVVKFLCKRAPNARF